MKPKWRCITQWYKVITQTSTKEVRLPKEFVTSAYRDFGQWSLLWLASDRSNYLRKQLQIVSDEKQKPVWTTSDVVLCSLTRWRHLSLLRRDEERVVGGGEEDAETDEAILAPWGGADEGEEADGVGRVHRPWGHLPPRGVVREPRTAATAAAELVDTEPAGVGEAGGRGEETLPWERGKQGLIGTAGISGELGQRE